jgi:hypothetical protein
MVNYARCKCLVADVSRGKNQTPFNGMEYDYLMWIDSDIIFNSELFQKLVDMDKDISSGWYCQPGGASSTGLYTPVVQTIDDEYFKEHGTYQFLTSDEISKKKKPFKVGYTGFGWILIKQGVFEKMEYPWFAPKLIKLGEDLQDVCSEDVSFCHDARDLKIDIWVNPEIRVGHEKTLVI